MCVLSYALLYKKNRAEWLLSRVLYGFCTATFHRDRFRLFPFCTRPFNLCNVFVRFSLRCHAAWCESPTRCLSRAAPSRALRRRALASRSSRWLRWERCRWCPRWRRTESSGPTPASPCCCPTHHSTPGHASTCPSSSSPAPVGRKSRSSSLGECTIANFNRCLLQFYFSKLKNEFQSAQKKFIELKLWN